MRDFAAMPHYVKPLAQEIPNILGAEMASPSVCIINHQSRNLVPPRKDDRVAKIHGNIRLLQPSPNSNDTVANKRRIVGYRRKRLRRRQPPRKDFVRRKLFQGLHETRMSLLLHKPYQSQEGRVVLVSVYGLYLNRFKQRATPADLRFYLKPTLDS